MSADNWAICPRCADRDKKAAEEERAAVMAMYGTVPVAEFDAARATLREHNPELFRIFREDYEFYGAEAGEIVASYSGHCDACGLSAAFKTSRKFWP